MRKIQKGHYGYIRARKKTLLIRTIILFLGVFILLAMGVALTHTKKNLLTVAAIVSVLPAANQAVVLFALLPYHGREKRPLYLHTKCIQFRCLSCCPDRIRYLSRPKPQHHITVPVRGSSPMHFAQPDRSLSSACVIRKSIGIFVSPASVSCLSRRETRLKEQCMLLHDPPEK